MDNLFNFNEFLFYHTWNSRVELDDLWRLIIYSFFPLQIPEIFSVVINRVSLKYLSGAEGDHSGRESSIQGRSPETTPDASQMTFFHLLFLTLGSYTFLYLY